MQVLYPRCCGLDVDHATVVACVRRPGKGRFIPSIFSLFALTVHARVVGCETPLGLPGRSQPNGGAR
jgi:hypothetical protein